MPFALDKLRDYKQYLLIAKGVSIMDHVQPFEELYKRYAFNLAEYLPDGMIEIDLPTLQKMHLLDCEDAESHSVHHAMTHYFQVIETEEKITLLNEQFIIWIVPSSSEGENCTRVYIALQQIEGSHLEMAFSVSGVYNTSRLLLRILEKYLEEIYENEELLCQLKKAS